ncbi:unnamed protein product [Calypogeia fissa]
MAYDLEIRSAEVRNAPKELFMCWGFIDPPRLLPVLEEHRRGGNYFKPL